MIARKTIIQLTKEVDDFGSKVENVEEKLANVDAKLDRVLDIVAGLSSSRQGVVKVKVQANPASKKKRSTEIATETVFAKEDVEFFETTAFADLFGLLHSHNCWPKIDGGKTRANARTCCTQGCMHQSRYYCIDCSASLSDPKELQVYCNAERHKQFHWVKVHKKAAENNG